MHDNSRMRRREFLASLPCAAMAQQAGTTPTLNVFAELVFLDTLWPDFDRRHLWAACEEYASRQRRFGSA